MIVDKADIKLPERVESHTCQLVLYIDGDPRTRQNPYSSFYRLVQTNVAEIIKVRSNSLKDYQAFPNVFAIRHDDDKDVLMVWPKPDKSYTGVFRYCPALKEI